MHEEAIHDEAERKRIAYCAVAPDSDHFVGISVMLVVTTMLGFVVRADYKCSVDWPVLG